MLSKKVLDLLADGTIAIGIVATLPANPVFLVNVEDIYQERKRDYLEQQRGNPQRPYHLEKPSLFEAIRDAIRFEISYLRHFDIRHFEPRVHTGNFDYDGILKRKAFYVG